MLRIFNSRAVEWLVVFLGNPGLEYAGTRHNVGFMAADELEKSKGVKINKFRFRSLTARCELGGSEVLLMKPQTYMNLSGEAVSEAARFYKIPPERVLVVSDDVALPLGKLAHPGMGVLIHAHHLQGFLCHPSVFLGVKAL